MNSAQSLRRVRCLFAFVCLLTASQACSEAPEVVSVLSHQNCQGLSTGVQRIQYADIASIRGAVMLDSSSNANANRAQTNAKNLIFLALSQGQQSTGGYDLRLSQPVRKSGSSLNIPVIWRTPAKGTLNIQMLTHPCLVVALEWSGKGKINFFDQQGAKLASYAGQSSSEVPLR